MVWSKLYAILGGLFFTIISFGQENRYMVFFKDKAGSSYSVSNPSDFLSPQAIDRRTLQGIVVNENDIPVNENYVNDVKNAGAQIYFRTKWMNGVLVQCTPSVLPVIEELSFVERIEFVAPGTKLQSGRKKIAARNKGYKSAQATEEQLTMLALNEMHAADIRGENVLIAIFDSGFQGVDLTSPFEHIRDENRIDLDVSHDFVYNTNDVFQYDEHGSQVFSVIAAYLSDSFVGGAYNASFQLYVTEDVNSEYRIEEYNWLFAAERADSAGVDIINSSLGYNTFDDPYMDYPTSAMDGKTTVVSRAAQWASDRGIIVVCSAGNEGANAWQVITAPADAVDVLAVGAVNSSGQRISSSSKGPNAEGRIKPDVVALGLNTSVILPNGNLGSATGTSLAAPLVTSLAAGVHQKYPLLSAKMVMEVIKNSASRASHPDNFIGYGIPTFSAVTHYLEELKKSVFQIYPNPSSDTLVIKPYDAGVVSSCQMELINVQGKVVQQKAINFSTFNPTETIDLRACENGLYVLRLGWNGKVYVFKVVKV